jgi:hypothetical protein
VLIHTGTKKKSLNNKQTKLNSNKSLTTMIYLLVMTMRMRGKTEEKEVRQEELTIQALTGSNILVKALVATIIITHKSQLHQ